jgi:hypothetical protein
MSQRLRGAPEAVSGCSSRVTSTEYEIEGVIEQAMRSLHLRRTLLKTIVANADVECFVCVESSGYLAIELAPELARQIADTGCDLILMAHEAEPGADDDRLNR